MLSRGDSHNAHLGSLPVQDSLDNVFAGVPRSDTEARASINQYSRITLDPRHDVVQQGGAGLGGEQERTFSGVKISV